MKYHAPTADPTPSEIRQACRNIQAQWTEQQERHRRGLRGGPKPYEFPAVEVTGFLATWLNPFGQEER